MTDTPQPETAGETVVSREDAIENAADAFKVHLGQVPERPRDEQGRFTAAQQEEIEAAAEAQEVEEEVESQEGEQEADEAADEAQPEAVDLPPSWPSELAEEWQTLPAPVQEKIVAREAEREAAVNAKFQEAANVRRANEGLIAEAQQSRQAFIEAADAALALIQPQWPSETMLVPGSADYNPDAYHYHLAQAQRAQREVEGIQQQRQHALAQLTSAAEAQAFEEINQIEAKTRPALFKDVPELTDPAKSQGALAGIVHYAIESGIPAEVFNDPDQAKYVTSAQIHLAWKAQQYDKMTAAKGKVTPKAQKPAAPPVRPGVTTSKSQIQAVQRKGVTDRLKREGSVEAGAAYFKTIL
jgi:hypothetical protein